MTVRAARLLFAHDLRLGWRDLRGAFRRLGDAPLVCLAVVLVLVVHAAAWVATRDRRLDLAPGTAFLMLLMTAQTLNAAVKLIHGRGDLDLVLSSPFPARIVLLVRGLAPALGAVASAAVFVVPVADVGLLRGDWRALALVPALAAGGLVATAASLLIAIAFAAALGPRRARIAAQIAATLVGGGFVVWLQVGRVLHLSPMPSGAPPAWLGRVAALPVRAASGDGASLATWVALAVLLYGGVALGLGGAFARLVPASAVVASGRRTRGRDRRFATGLNACLRAKEWRLLRRDPWILSQLFQQTLYMAPLLVGLWSGAGGDRPLTVALAPMIVVVAYQVAASMTWLGLSGEDAPDLLATAPVTGRALRLGKLAAVGRVVAGMAAVPLAWLTALDWRVAPGTAGLAGLAVCMAMTLGVWHVKPTRRTSFAARHRESRLLALMETAMAMLLGVAAALLAAGAAWALLPLAGAGVILLANRPRGRRRSRDEQAAPAREPGQQAA